MLDPFLEQAFVSCVVGLLGAAGLFRAGLLWGPAYLLGAVVGVLCLCGLAWKEIRRDYDLRRTADLARFLGHLLAGYAVVFIGVSILDVALGLGLPDLARFLYGPS